MNGRKELLNCKPRIWAALLFTVPLYLRAFDPWLEAFFVTIVLGITAWPYIKKGKAFNKFTLLSVSILVAYSYSFLELIFSSKPVLYFKPVAVCSILILVWVVLQDVLREMMLRPIQNFLTLLPETALKIFPDGKKVEVPLNSIVKGDCVRVYPHEVIPVDGLILSGVTCVDESGLFGPAAPVKKGFGDFVSAGSLNVEEMCTIQASQVGEMTAYAGMAQTVSQLLADRKPSPIYRKMIPLMVGLAIIALLFWSLVASLDVAVMTASSMLMIACPGAFDLGARYAKVQSITVGLQNRCDKAIIDQACEKIESQNRSLAILYTCIAVPLALFGVVSLFGATISMILITYVVALNALRY